MGAVSVYWVSANGLGLCEEAELEAQMFGLAQMFNRRTAVEFSTEPAFSQNPCYVQGYETASKRAFVISIAFGLMSQPIKFRFSSLQTTAVVPLPK